MTYQYALTLAEDDGQWMASVAFLDMCIAGDGDNPEAAVADLGVCLTEFIKDLLETGGTLPLVSGTDGTGGKA